MQPKKMKKSSESICRLKNCKAFVPRDLQVPLDSAHYLDNLVVFPALFYGMMMNSLLVFAS